MTSERVNERVWWEFVEPGKKEPVRLEHRGITPEQAADFLIGQGALTSRACACCGHHVPINGTKVRHVRAFGHCVAQVDGEDRWVEGTTVNGDWRTYPLSKKSGGN